jgi:hypothetical protein
MPYSSALKKDAVRFYEKSANFNRTTRRHIPEDSNLVRTSNTTSCVVAVLDDFHPTSTSGWRHVSESDSSSCSTDQRGDCEPLHTDVLKYFVTGVENVDETHIVGLFIDSKQES